MSAYQETMEILKRYKIQANKSLGQNFLVNDDVIDKIIETADIKKDDLIIEIGPGLGVLTNRILEKSNNVIAVELDKRMVRILKDRFAKNIEENIKNVGEKNLEILEKNIINRENAILEIINDDILKVDLSSLIQNKKQKLSIRKVKIVANLPYYISTPIIMKLLEQKLEIDEMIVMVQKEVAERLTAKTGTRLSGAITYAVEYFAEASTVVKVPKESFMPSPKVESMVIKLKVRNIPKIEVKDEKVLFNIIQKSFTQRRKTLANTLVNYNIAKNKIDVEDMFTKLEINSNVRGENLTLEQFGKIADYCSGNI